MLRWIGGSVQLTLSIGFAFMGGVVFNGIHQSYAPAARASLIIFLISAGGALVCGFSALEIAWRGGRQKAGAIVRAIRREE